MRHSTADPSRPGLYVHVPFCHSECTYCDFYRTSYRDDRADRYLEALRAETSSLGTGFVPRTLYVGGGTPSALKEHQLEILLGILRPYEPFVEEYTFEVNPRSITPAKVELLARAGVNRVSFGAQTFSDERLALLGRRHKGEDIERAFELLRSRIGRISFDLIFALPGETLEEWDSDLSRAIDLAPDHLSLYSLLYESGTPITRQVLRGELSPVSEDLEREMFLHARRRLRNAGYEHYEVSSYCRPGHRSVHNAGYWLGRDYVGLGPGASSTRGPLRSTNIKDLEAYVEGLRRNGAPPREEEHLSRTTLLNEMILLRLRTSDGLLLEEFRELSGADLESYSGGRASALIEQGFLLSDGGRLTLSDEGLPVADAVIAELIA